MEDYIEPQIDIDEFVRLLFECSFNVPRIMGFVLNYCYNDRISQGLRINTTAIKLAAQKYYETVIKQYFERLNRFALEPFERKLDRHIPVSYTHLCIQLSSPYGRRGFPRCKRPAHQR